MLIRIVTLLLIITCVFYDETLFANPPYQTVESMLSEQKTIRVLADASPGMGNQAATANVVMRLRQWGFKGRIEFIYGKVVLDKITTLYDLPKNISADYLDEKRNIRFIQVTEHLQRLNNHEMEYLTLGMSGANDTGGCGVLSKDGIELPESSPLCRDEANFMGVRVFVEYNPYPPSKFNAETNFVLADPAPLEKPSWPYQIGSKLKYFSMPTTTLDEVKVYLHTDPRGQILLQQKPGLSAFIDALENQNINIMASYGWPLLIPDGSHDNCGTEDGEIHGCFPGNILQLLTAAHYVQLNASSSLQNPLIIAVFYDYRREMQAILNIINDNNWGQFAQEGSKEASLAIQQLGLRGKVFTGDIADLTVSQQIKNLKKGEILLLSMGSLPKNVFDGLYTYTDVDLNSHERHIWPQIREGANSFDSLILTGRPHLRCFPSWEMSLDNITDPIFKMKMQNLYGFDDYHYEPHLCAGMQTWHSNPNLYQLLGEFLMDAHDPHSAFSNYFVERQIDATDLQNDRIYFGLIGALPYINAN